GAVRSRPHSEDQQDENSEGWKFSIHRRVPETELPHHHPWRGQGVRCVRLAREIPGDHFPDCWDNRDPVRIQRLWGYERGSMRKPVAIDCQCHSRATPRGGWKEMFVAAPHTCRTRAARSESQMQL